MRNFQKHLFLCMYLFLSSCMSFAQYEFYNNGSVIFVNDKPSTTVATIRVNGSITNNDGDFTNNLGLIELEGNWLNTSIANHYTSTGIERFISTYNQTISGNWNGTSLNHNQFYDLKINKSSSTGEYISLSDSININAVGSVEFESTNGIIRTQASSTGTSSTNCTGNYINSIYLQNPNPSAFTGYSTGQGATTKYIEGKLKRQVDRTGAYYFPVGVKSSLLGGMNSFQLKFNTTPSSAAIVGYLEQYDNVGLITSDYVYSDVAQVDNNTASINNFSTCIGPPDGIMDQAKLTNHTQLQWRATTYDASAWNYDIALYPSSALDATASYANIPCGPYGIVKYIARNGVPGGNLSILQPSATFGNTIGYFMNITRDTLIGQTGFSSFQLWGATDLNTTLPVELTYLQAKGINNEYIKVNWQTASENDNKGFVLQRESNGIFDSIAWIPGNGNSNILRAYAFDDRNVEKGIIYYYRLKQIDYSNKFLYSSIVSAKLQPEEVESVTLFPNPSNGNTTIKINAVRDDRYIVNVFNDIGQLIYNDIITTAAGTVSKIELPASEWTKGMYIIKVQSDDNKTSKGIKFIKS